jgi:type III secretion system YscQ/HrcQ family protein
MQAAPSPSPLGRLRRMTSREARRRSSWARTIDAHRDVKLPHRLRAQVRGVPGLFAPAAFDRLYGPGMTAFSLGDDVEPRVTVIALTSARSVRAILTHILGGTGAELGGAPLDELEAGAAHFVASTIIEAVAGNALRLGLVITERHAIREALGAEIWDFLSVDLACGEQRHVVDVLRRGPLPERRSVPPRTHTRRLAVPLSLTVGFTSLSLAELASLSAGDALLLEHAAAEQAAYLHVPGTRYARSALLDRRSVVLGPRVELPTTHQQVPMNDEHTTRPLNDAQIDVSAELARTSLRIFELERLAEGEILQLGVEVGEAVTLRAGDVIIARGELVDVDGRLGVLIRSIGA